MRTKSSQFIKFLSSTSFAIYVLCESGLSSDIYSNEYFNNMYIVYRCDRSSLTSAISRGGGVVVAVLASIKSREISCPHKNIEYVAVLLMCNSRNIFLYTAYIPPSSSFEIYNAHCENITFFVANSKIEDIVCLLGDSNLPNVNWISENDLGLSLMSSNFEQTFCDSVSALNLHQVCNVPNQNMKYLDLVFLNEPNFGTVVKSLSPFVPDRIHHVGLEINLDFHEVLCQFNSKCDDALTYNFYKADWLQLNSFIESIDWYELFYRENNDDVNFMAMKLYSKLHEAFACSK